MTKKIRTFLFFLCLVLFSLSAPSVLLYSQGYRIDFENKKLTKTGAFYFKILPKAAEVSIDGKLKKKTDFFFGSVFIENLLPRKYFVEIKKNGYLDWKKNLEIKEKEVTEAKNVFLVPGQLNLELLSKGVLAFFFSPDETRIILKEEGFDDEKKSWSLKLYNLERGIKSHLVEEKQISKNGVEILDLIWSPLTDTVLLKTLVEGEQKYILLSLKEEPFFIKTVDFLENALDPSFSSIDSQKIFFLEPGKVSETSPSLFEANIEEKTVNLLIEDVITYKVSNDNIFLISKDGSLKKSSLSGDARKISLASFPLKETAQYQIDIVNSFVFLKEDDNLFWFDENVRKFKEVKTRVKGFQAPSDSKKIAIFNDFELWIFFLKDELSQPTRKAESKLFLTRFSEKIENIFWWGDHYLIFNAGSKIKVIEIDDRDRAQIWDLAELESPKIFWSQKNKKLFILSKDNFFLSRSLF